MRTKKRHRKSLAPRVPYVSTVKRSHIPLWQAESWRAKHLIDTEVSIKDTHGRLVKGEDGKIMKVTHQRLVITIHVKMTHARGHVQYYKKRADRIVDMAYVAKLLEKPDLTTSEYEAYINAIKAKYPMFNPLKRNSWKLVEEGIHTPMATSTRRRKHYRNIVSRCSNPVDPTRPNERTTKYSDQEFRAIVRDRLHVETLDLDSPDFRKVERD